MDKIESILEKRIVLASREADALRLILSRGKDKIEEEQNERVRLNYLREKSRSVAEKAIAATERVLRGKDESNVISPSPSATAAGAPVARIHEIYRTVEPKGFGTGFLVAPNILITNQHVFENAGAADNCVANFRYEFNETIAKIDEGFLYRIRPDIFFYSCKELDFSIVFVEEKPVNGDTTLSTYGYRPLIETKGKVVIGDPMNIIQYPNGGVKKYTTEENEVFNIDDERGVIYYYTDTEIGSSGSPCFNNFWEVAALHYTAVPETNKQGEWLTTEGKVWDKHSMSMDQVHWIANAGKSISKIVSHLKSLTFQGDGQVYLKSILDNAIDKVITPSATESVNQPKQAYLSPEKNNDMGNITLNFYGTSNVYFSSPSQVLPKQETGATAVGEDRSNLAIEKKERFDEDYTNRIGYVDTFLQDFVVPLPKVKNESAIYKKFGATKPFIVKYHHYSLVMNKKRRMAMWTACNVDYNKYVRDNREREDFGNGAWRIDERVPVKYQIQADEFYDPATLIDKGHLVRRDDNCWAVRKNNRTDSIGIEYANADTFHWTNCTPQHEAFNRDVAQYKGIGKWGVLENEIKRQLEFPQNDTSNPQKDFSQRACIFCGPIFKDDDPEYMDIQFPLKFWKVFAIHSAENGNLVYGFILSQKDKIDDTGLEREGVPRWNKMVSAMQVSLKKIENESGVLFDEILHDFDVNKDSDDTELNDDMSNLRRRR